MRTGKCRCFPAANAKMVVIRCLRLRVPPGRNPGAGQVEGGPGDWRRVELWQHATASEPARLLGVLSEFDPAGVAPADLSVGRWLAFTPGSSTAGSTLVATWSLGGAEARLDLDTDGDRLPDGYESSHGLNPRDPRDAALDVDGDGWTALDEYPAGTDPRSKTSRFRIERISAVEGRLEPYPCSKEFARSRGECGENGRP